jgi:Mn-dependent DtxR family transcriptional regulator
MNLLTNRDKEYLRVIYLLQGTSIPIGPVKLSKKMGVTKVCAFQKMHRLEALGCGKYILRKGLVLNKKAITMVEKDMKRHHILESFLQKKLGLSHDQACLEAEKLDQSMSQKLFDKINDEHTRSSSSCCSYNPENKPTVSDLKTCPWIQRLLKKKENTGET